MKKIVLAIIIAIIGLLPMAVKKITDDSIAKKSIELRENGVDLNILNSNGYFKSKRDYILKIEDAEKFKKYVSSELSKKYPEYDFITKMFSNKETEVLDNLLKGIIFKGYIENSNINYFENIKVNTFFEFSGEIMRELEKDKRNPFYIMVEKKLISLDMLFNRSGDFVYSKLKDINETFQPTKSDKLKLELTGQEVKNEPNNERIITDVLLDKFLLDYIDKENSLKTSFNNFKYDINMKTQLDAFVKLNLDNLLINFNDFKINLKNTYLDSDGKSKGKLYTTKNVFKISNLNVNEKNKSFSADAVNLNFDILDLDYESLKKFYEKYKENTKISFKLMNKNNLRDEVIMKEYFKVLSEMMAELNKLINKGFSLALDLDLNNVITQDLISLKSIKVDLDGKINENKLDIKSLRNPLQVLGSLDSTINITMFKEDLENIFKVAGPLSMMVAPFVKEENGKVIFDIKVDKGNILINGKKLQ